MKKDNAELSLDALDAKYGLPLFEKQGKPGIYAHVMPGKLGFRTTAELEAPAGLERILGQEEQLSAIMEGLAIQRSDYNLIIKCGSEQDVPLLIKAVTEEYAAKAEVQNVDQIAWQNFNEPLSPKTGSVPAGYGKIFRSYMEKEIAGIASYKPKASELEGYAGQMLDFTKKIAESNTIVKKIEEEALAKFKKEGVEVEKNMGAIIVKEPEKLNAKQKKKAAEIASEVKKKMDEQIIDSAKGYTDFINDGTAKAIKKYALAKSEDIIAQYEIMAEAGTISAESLPAIKEYITDVFTHIAEHPEKLKEEKASGLGLLMGIDASPEKGVSEFLPHIIVDNTKKEGLISIVETDPNPSALLGSIEHSQKASHLRLNAGLLARANRGVLAITHADWALHPQGILKYKILQALETGKADIGGISLYDKVDAKCEAKTKLMLFVSDLGKYLAMFPDNDRFIAYFKKRIALKSEMPMTLENIAKLGKAVKGEVIESGLPDFDCKAVARLAEYLMLPFGKKKLSTDVSFYRDILVRAGVSAKNAGRDIATGEDIDTAYRNYKNEKNTAEKWFREYIGSGKIIVGDSPEVGVVNGLAVLSAEIPFGNHLRIGVTVRPNNQGLGRFVNIDKDAGLSGKMFTKSFLQVASMLKEKYMDSETQFNFDLEASVSQSDHGIDGPSAGAAMSLACISAIANIPVQPYVFITGGIDPKSGNVTPVGGINEKVMGAYQTCRDLGIEQAIAVIPKANVENLHLVDREVHEAIKSGRFRVYAHSNINETLEIGTRMPASEVHAKVKEQLNSIQEWLKKDKKEDKKE
ncbi:MAG: AAA family ATPase [Candidatus Nanoarchaeia archaeon]|nr:AAA family ATPase [Candidatus Nanoarchaeia archaeon]